ncbi:F-box/LRR-repeat protein 13-like [Panicum miliaceum]|uniref:F-box/LRR-repeat protein 13-like n=1 Tax=Panicum miliaceum TaxID=4540 RepID=A0A3L6SD07_PANMI|nr:F-box/LRR-repeat protein 13-like [Panicum miliaceum]
MDAHWAETSWWHRLFAAKGVEELTFFNRAQTMAANPSLPDTLFNCSSLTRLYLGFWRFPATVALPHTHTEGWAGVPGAGVVGAPLVVREGWRPPTTRTTIRWSAGALLMNEIEELEAARRELGGAAAVREPAGSPLVNQAVGDVLLKRRSSTTWRTKNRCLVAILVERVGGINCLAAPPTLMSLPTLYTAGSRATTTIQGSEEEDAAKRTANRRPAMT